MPIPSSPTILLKSRDLPKARTLSTAKKKLSSSEVRVRNDSFCMRAVLPVIVRGGSCLQARKLALQLLRLVDQDGKALRAEELGPAPEGQAEQRDLIIRAPAIDAGLGHDIQLHQPLR